MDVPVSNIFFYLLFEKCISVFLKSIFLNQPIQNYNIKVRFCDGHYIIF